VSLTPLVVTGVTSGMYGRACVLVGDSKGRPLPAHRMGAGDEVRLHSTKGKGGETEITDITGVVGKMTEQTVEIVSDDADDAGALRAPLRLDVVASEATHKKLMQGLDALETYPAGGPAERVRNVLFGLEPHSLPMPPTLMDLGNMPGPKSSGLEAVINSALNDSQRAAVAFALESPEVALIHGPPGTGKTTAVVELVLRAVAWGQRCLVCAPSNVAVDGVLERLVAMGGAGLEKGHGARPPRVVRLGHPARLLPKVLEHSMEALVASHDGTAIVRDIHKEISTLVGRLRRGREGKEVGKGRPGRAEQAGCRREFRKEVGVAVIGAPTKIKALRKDARKREEKVVKEVLRSREVVLATCVGAATSCLREEEFDMVIIDEAAQ
ncbi:unnamed protein product, partial [Choristocarpus tenellus]